MATTNDNRWVLVSTNSDGTLAPTGIVHHELGCGMNNGRNVLMPVGSDEAAGMAHCQRCEAKLGMRQAVARPPEGRKIEVRLSEDVLSRVDAYASKSNHTRAAALREIISAGIDHV